MVSVGDPVLEDRHPILGRHAQRTHPDLNTTTWWWTPSLAAATRGILSVLNGLNVLTHDQHRTFPQDGMWRRETARIQSDLLISLTALKQSARQFSSCHTTWDRGTLCPTCSGKEVPAELATLLGAESRPGRRTKG